MPLPSRARKEAVWCRRQEPLPYGRGSVRATAFRTRSWRAGGIGGHGYSVDPHPWASAEKGRPTHRNLWFTANPEAAAGPPWPYYRFIVGSTDNPPR